MTLKTVFRGFFIAILAMVTALPLMASPATAAPSDKVSAKVQTNDNTIQVRMLAGTVAIKDGFLEYRNDAGKTVDRTPLTYIAPDNRTYPIDATVVGRTATLVPSKNAARSTATPAALLEKTNVADADGFKSKRERDDAALARFNSEMAAGMTISTIVGTIVGVLVGAVVGCVLSIGVGCVPGLTVGATLGGIAGTIVGGGSSILISAQRYFNTINKPFKNVKSSN